MKALAIILFSLMPFIGCNDIQEFFSPSVDDAAAASVGEDGGTPVHAVSEVLSPGGVSGMRSGTMEFALAGNLGDLRSVFPWDYHWVLLSLPLRGLHAAARGFVGSEENDVPPANTSVCRVIEAIRCEGAGDYLAVAPVGPLASAESALTVEAWVRFEGGDDCAILSGAGTNGFSLSVLRSGRVSVTLPTLSGKCLRLTPGGMALTAGQWYHLAVTYDSCAATVYVDGMIDTSVVSHGPLCLRDSLEDPSAELAIRGTVDELRVWAVALPNEKLRERMNIPLSGTEAGLLACWDMNGDIVDKSPYSSHVGVHGRPSFFTTTR